MKGFKGNIWNMPTNHCNRLVHERMETNKHERHIRALESTRGMVDRACPKDHPHLKSKPKTRKLQEDRASEIQLENRILLQKMLNIDTKPSTLSTEALSRDRVNLKSIHGGAQRRELDRISAANQDLLRRLQGAKPSIDPRQWEEEEMDRQALKCRLSQNACRGRVPRLRMPERVAIGDRLPRIAGPQSQFRENDWAELTNQELDDHLRQAERAAGLAAAGAAPPLTDG
mmetsp:Transcript_117409/g.328676  ORF Transcript_117409/g.328676 Transcript_117409/m.328676 type:complete len:229 (+) Transcript_117409:96-782(+)